MPVADRARFTRAAGLLGWVVLVVALLGFAGCVVMYAWGVGHLTGALLGSTVELQTDRLLEAGVPQPVIECVRVGAPLGPAELAMLDTDGRDMVDAAAGQVESVRLRTGIAADSGRRSALLVGMLCAAMAVVAVWIVARSRRSII